MIWAHGNFPFTEFPNPQVKNFLRLLYSQLSSDQFVLNLKVALVTRQKNFNQYLSFTFQIYINFKLS